MSKNVLAQNLLFIKRISQEITMHCTILKDKLYQLFLRRVKFRLRKVFTIVFEMRSTTKGLFTKQIAKRLKLVEQSKIISLKS
jgi:hypothetical protein